MMVVESAGSGCPKASQRHVFEWRQCRLRMGGYEALGGDQGYSRWFTLWTRSPTPYRIAESIRGHGLAATNRERVGCLRVNQKIQSSFGWIRATNEHEVLSSFFLFILLTTDFSVRPFWQANNADYAIVDTAKI